MGYYYAMKDPDLIKTDDAAQPASGAADVITKKTAERRGLLKRLVPAAVFALCSFLLVFAARRAGDGFWSAYTAFSRSACGALAWLTSFTRFALWEPLAVALVVFVIARLISGIRSGAFWKRLCGLVLLLAAGSFALLGIWGLNYYAPPMAGRVGLSEELYTPRQLAEAVNYYMEQAEAWAPQAERGDDGMLVMDIDALAAAAGEGYDALALEYPDFSGSRVRVKTLLSSPVMAKVGTTGVFVALTGESGVSTKVYPSAMPFTICHEMGHRLSFARENEANFAAYLACDAASDPALKYSGYYMAFIYCYNALYAADTELAMQTVQSIGPWLLADLNATTAHYDALEDEKAEAVYDAVYDSYLKTMSVDSGIQSYGEVVDLIAMWYFQRLKQ